MSDVIVISSDSSDSDEADPGAQTVLVSDDRRPDPLLGVISMPVYLSVSKAWGPLPASATQRTNNPVERPQRRVGDVRTGVNNSREGSRMRHEEKKKEEHLRASSLVPVSSTEAAAAAASPAVQDPQPGPPRKKLRLSLSRPPPVPSPPPKDLTKEPQRPMPEAVRTAMRKDQDLQRLLRGLRPELPGLKALAEDSCRREAGVQGLGYVNRAFRSMETIADRELPISPWTKTTRASIRGLETRNIRLPSEAQNQHRNSMGGGGEAPGSLHQQQQQQQRPAGAAMDPAGLARLFIPPPHPPPPYPEGPGASSAAAAGAAQSVLIMRPDGAGTKVLRSRSDAAGVSAACSREAAKLIRKIGAAVAGGSRGTRRDGPAAATRAEGAQQQQKADKGEKRRTKKEAKKKRRSLGPKKLTEFDAQPCDPSG